MTANQTVASTLITEIHLLGVPPLANYVDHVKRRALDGEDADEGRLIDQWRAAARHYERLAQSEAGEADLVGIEPIPPAMAPWIDQLTAAADFQQVFSSLPIAFGLIELDRLVICQQHVLLDHSAQFEQILGAAGDEGRQAAAFDICLPLEPHAPPISQTRSARGKFVFQSELSDLRAYSPRLINDATAQTLLTSNGYAQAGVAVTVGFGARHLNAVRLGKRMVLNNGYHRAFALRCAGFTHVPCVVQSIAHPEELAFAGGSSLIDNFDDIFKSARPPLFKDFFDPELTTRIRMPRTRKQIQITVSVETIRVPG